MEGLADQLFLAGCEVSEQELITSILNGLPANYDVTVEKVGNRLQGVEISDQ